MLARDCEEKAKARVKQLFPESRPLGISPMPETTGLKPNLSAVWHPVCSCSFTLLKLENIKCVLDEASALLSQAIAARNEGDNLPSPFRQEAYLGLLVGPPRDKAGAYPSASRASSLQRLCRKESVHVWLALNLGLLCTPQAAMPKIRSTKLFCPATSPFGNQRI